MESVLALWHVSAVSSEVVCIIFWWAAKAGLQGDVPRLALSPGGRSGNYKRHLDTCLGHAKGRLLHSLLPVPGHKRRDLTRTVHDVPTMPLHEVLAKELRDSATVPFKLEEARENGTLRRAHWDHPVEKASSTLVLPVHFYTVWAHTHKWCELDLQTTLRNLVKIELDLRPNFNMSCFPKENASSCRARTFLLHLLGKHAQFRR